MNYREPLGAQPSAQIAEHMTSRSEMGGSSVTPAIPARPTPNPSLQIAHLLLYHAIGRNNAKYWRTIRAPRHSPTSNPRLSTLCLVPHTLDPTRWASTVG